MLMGGVFGGDWEVWEGVVIGERFWRVVWKV